MQKTREGFEKFAQERKKKRMKEQQEEKLTSKMPDKEGDASDTDMAKQQKRLLKKNTLLATRQTASLDDIEKINFFLKITTAIEIQ